MPMSTAADAPRAHVSHADAGMIRELVVTD
jgi:hypothetical protein